MKPVEFIEIRKKLGLEEVSEEEMRGLGLREVSEIEDETRDALLGVISSPKELESWETSLPEDYLSFLLGDSLQFD